jgi:HEPN domain-containing protein
MKRASGQWLESAEMDIESIDQIIQREERKVPKEHSTLKLYGLVKELIPLEADMEILTDLDDLYIESRYPGELGLLPDGKPTRADAQQFYDCAKNVYEQVKRILDSGR